MYTTKASLNTSPPYISISNVMAITNTCNVNYHFDREREKYTNAQLIYNKAKQYAYRCIGEVSDNHNQYPLKCCQILFLDMSKRGETISASNKVSPRSRNVVPWQPCQKQSKSKLDTFIFTPTPNNSFFCNTTSNKLTQKYHSVKPRHKSFTFCFCNIRRANQASLISVSVI